MKLKIVFLGFILVSLFGCNSDDSNSGSQQLEINTQNLLGKWYLKGQTVNEGTFQYYVHKCPAEKDYYKFFENHLFLFDETISDCSMKYGVYSDWNLDGNVLAITPRDPLLADYHEFTIMSITTEELTLKSVKNTTEGMITEISKYTRN